MVIHLLLLYYSMRRTLACTVVGVVLFIISLMCHVIVMGVGWALYLRHALSGCALVQSTVSVVFVALYLNYALMYCTDITAWSETGKAIVTCLAVLEMFAGFIQILAAIQFIYAGFTFVGPNVFAYGVSAGVCGIIGGCAGFCSQVCFCTLLCTPNTREDVCGIIAVYIGFWLTICSRISFWTLLCDNTSPNTCEEDSGRLAVVTPENMNNS